MIRPVPDVPAHITFERLGGRGSKFSWRVVDFRAPRQHEFYLSGAVAMAYRAPNNLTASYHIVEPVQEFVMGKTTWIPKEAQT